MMYLVWSWLKYTRKNYENSCIMVKLEEPPINGLQRLFAFEIVDNIIDIKGVETMG